VALDNETVADFMRELQTSPYFVDVDLDESVGSGNAELAGFKAVTLGPRILRTETAAVAALAIAQGLWGDL
jgi:hypothetical protein